jgi:hypothetical protein
MIAGILIRTERLQTAVKGSSVIRTLNLLALHAYDMLNLNYVLLYVKLLDHTVHSFTWFPGNY